MTIYAVDDNGNEVLQLPEKMWMRLPNGDYVSPIVEGYRNRSGLRFVRKIKKPPVPEGVELPDQANPGGPNNPNNGMSSGEVDEIIDNI